MQAFSLTIPYLYLIHVLIVSMRVGSGLLFAPIWGHPGLPQYLRVLLVFSIAAGLSTIVPFNANAYSNPGLIIPMEFLLGLLIAMGIRIAFAGLHLGGQLISYNLGFSAVQAIDPQTQNRSTLMSSYLTMLGYLFVLGADQHHTIFRALADSYTAFPIGGSVAPTGWFPAVIEASAQLFVIGWKIALPVFVATFFLELVVAFVGRMQLQINPMVISAPLKLLVGMVILGASLAFVPRLIAPMVEAVMLRK
jgi:flagellar biosynthetic protein FliR